MTVGIGVGCHNEKKIDEAYNKMNTYKRIYNILVDSQGLDEASKGFRPERSAATRKSKEQSQGGPSLRDLGWKPGEPLPPGWEWPKKKVHLGGGSQGSPTGMGKGSGPLSPGFLAGSARPVPGKDRRKG